MPRKTASENGTGRDRPSPRSRTRKQSAPAVAQAARAAAAAAGAVSGSEDSIPREEIERLAYYYWLERGGQGGSPEDDWFRAEAELRRQRGLDSKSD